MKDQQPKDISPDIIAAAHRNPAIRQRVELYLHAFTGDVNTIDMSWQKTLESCVIELNKQVEDLTEVIKLHGVIKRPTDVLLLKDALVNETAPVLQKLGAGLRWERLRQKLTLKALCLLRGKPYTYNELGLIERGMHDFKISTLLDICRALKLKLSIAAIPNEEEGETSMR